MFAFLQGGSEEALGPLLNLEVATTPEQHALGLSHRTHLGPDAGMLFLLPREFPGSVGFWMKNTTIPLDIAYLDSALVVRAILSMQPCPTGTMECPKYPPGVAYYAALEVNQGWFRHHGVAVGDRLTDFRENIRPIP